MLECRPVVLRLVVSSLIGTGLRDRGDRFCGNLAGLCPPNACLCCSQQRPTPVPPSPTLSRVRLACSVA